MAGIKRHVEGPRVTGLDYFEDRETQSEQASIGGTEAARITTELEESIHPNGLQLKWHCNCGRHVAVTCDWCEIAAIAHNVSPSVPLPLPSGQKMALSDDPWKWDQQKRQFYPQIPCPGGCNNPRHVFLTQRDGERALTQAVENGLTANDPKYQYAQAIFNPKRLERRMDPI